MMSKQRYTLVILSQRHLHKRIFQLLLFSLIVILVGGGVALLLQTQPSSHASGGSVVGPPTLPASMVDAIFARLGSPMVGTGKVVVQASQKAKVDDAFALAVWWVETNDGAAGVGRADRNPGSVRGSVGYPSAFDGYTIYPSYSDAVVYWFGMIRHSYVDRGLSTVYAISHPYVGTSTSPLWAAKVTKLMLRYRSEAPAPHVVKASPKSPYVVSMLRKYRRLPGGYTGTAVSYDREQAEMTSISASSQPPIWGELGLTLFALLAACIITIGAIRLRRVRPVPISMRNTSPLLSLVRFTPGISAISLSDSGPLPVQTEPLVKVGIALSGAGYRQGHPNNREDTYEGDHDTEVPLRRVVLVPSQLTQPASSRSLEPVGTRPTGLLSRYKWEQMALNRFEQD